MLHAADKTRDKEESRTKMNTLQLPDQRTSILLGQNKGIRRGDPVRPSQFAVVFDYGERRVLHNTFTCQCVETDRLAWFEDRREMPYDPDDAEMVALVQADFLVAAHIDEAERYGKILELLRKMQRKKTGYNSYTILPTTACNARCVYCYEAGIPFETMTDETADQVVRYICATRRPGAKLNLHWFGGEPLMGEKVIDRICAALRDEGIEYRSGMITNGSLFTEELVSKAKEDWHLGNVQITLDGREEEYCARKRYVSFGSSPYRAVLDGIRALLAKEIRVSIRLNVDEENMAEMHALADDLEREFPEEKGISIYSHSIFVEPGDEEERDDDAFYEALEKLNDRLWKFNRGHGNGGDVTNGIDSVPAESGEDKEQEEKEGAKEKRGMTKRYYCMADNPGTGPVIKPNGELYICEHIVGIPVVGHVGEERPIDRSIFVEATRLAMERCRACPMLPACTDFSGCPTENRDCFREMTAMERAHLSAVFKVHL